MISGKAHILVALRNWIARVEMHQGKAALWVKAGVDEQNPADVVGVLSLRLVGAAAEIEPQETVEIVEEKDDD